MSVRGTFASAVVQKRLEKQYTQQQVADAVSISLRTYQHVEKGDRSVKTETLLAIMLLLGIDAGIFKSVIHLNEITPTTPTGRYPRPRLRTQ